MNKNKKILGFTLIELLVVVSIIAMIASIILSALGTAKQRAQDTAKVRELQEVRTALQMYFGDNGYYPGADFKDLLTIGTKKYISSISNNVNYAVTGGCTQCNTYTLITNLSTGEYKVNP